MSAEPPPSKALDSRRLRVVLVSSCIAVLGLGVASFYLYKSVDSNVEKQPSQRGDAPSAAAKSVPQSDPATISRSSNPPIRDIPVAVASTPSTARDQSASLIIRTADIGEVSTPPVDQQ